MSFPFQNI